MEDTSDQLGLADALAVARGDIIPTIGEGDAKLLAFLLREGECNVEITESIIFARYSWLARSTPSRYFVRLAPGLISRLMQLGALGHLAHDATFSVGPGTLDIHSYPVDFGKKWIRIQCEDNRILIRVRNEHSHLHDPSFEFPGNLVLCERCRKELSTPLAKQCLHCGYDWH